MEKWKIILDYPNYEISSWGRVRVKERVNCYYTNQTDRLVRRTKKAKMIQTIVTSSNRVIVGLYNENGCKRKYIHRLIAVAFLDNKEQYPAINHVDANPTNNSLDNLEWCTQSHNILHAFKIGTKSNAGEKNAMSKLTKCDILEIKKMYRTNLFSQYLLGEMFKVRQNTISRIINNQRWNKER